MAAAARPRTWTALLWVALALVAIGATVLVMLPASWFAQAFHEQTRELLSVDDVEGTLWSGNAALVVGAPDGGAAPFQLPGRLLWTVDPVALLQGHVSATIAHSSACPHPVAIVGRPSKLELGPANITLPTGIIARLGPLLNTLGIDGVMQLSWGHLDLSRGQASGRAELELVDARSNLSTVVPLGSYRVVLDGEGSSGTITLTTTKGPLMLSGSGSWGGGRASFRGLASADSSHREQLADLLGILGKPDGDGVVFSYGAQ